ncbi:MAG: alkaline phosphatase family protein [Solirubrobacteraceae bacterium]
MPTNLTRRQLLHTGAMGGATLGTWSLLTSRLVEKALANAGNGCGSLHDIQHIVILIQENRSFDHYFGAYRGVAGFQDPHALPLRDGSGLNVFAQPGYPGGFRGNHLYPFHLYSSTKQGECTNDVDHGWTTQHLGWNHGRMDRILAEHMDPDVNGPKNGPLTMGYYTRQDLEFYYALADAFTLCDHYHCSVIGPTDPNRLYSLTATLDPDGKHGGPLVETLVSDRLQTYGKYTWKTMPEVLQEAGVSWKVYEAPENLSPVSDYVLPYFKQYQTNAQLAANAFGHTFPGDFQTDCAAGTLPQVSWVVAPVLDSEHPPTPPIWGEWATAQTLNSLLQNQGVWESSALLVTYDENGGFFDHVPPPTAPVGTPGEYITVPLKNVSGAGQIAGPIGLGFRVPMLVVSPFSRGGFVASQIFDHTSTLKLLAARFAAEGVHVPNISAWRNRTVGNMTSAFNFARVNSSVPDAVRSKAKQPSLVDKRVLGGDCTTSGPASEYSETGPGVQYYPVKVNRAAPPQEPGRPRRPSGRVACKR